MKYIKQNRNKIQELAVKTKTETQILIKDKTFY